MTTTSLEAPSKATSQTHHRQPTCPPFIGILCLAMLLAPAARSADQLIFHAAADLLANEVPNGSAANPNGTWTYGGYSNVWLSSPVFTAIPFSASSPNPHHTDSWTLTHGEFQGWANTSGDNVPAFVVNTTPTNLSSGGSLTPIRSHKVFMHPGPGGRSIYDDVAVRWTAPRAGMISVTGNWIQRDRQPQFAHVLMNGVREWTALTTSNAGVTVFNTVPVVAHDVIDFVLSPGSLGYSWGGTEFDATITYTDWTTAVSLDGIDDYVDLPDGVWLTNAFTVEGWVYLKSHTEQMRFFDFGNDYEADNIHAALSVDYDQHLVQFGSPVTWSWVTTSTPIPLHTWTHVAFVYDTLGTGHIYFNGTDVASGPLTLPLNVHRTHNFLGRGVSSQYANAILDEVRVWSVARNATQLGAAMRSILTGTEPGLVAYYRFNEQTGAVVYDATANHLDGTLVNQPERTPFYWVPSIVFNGPNPYGVRLGFPFVDPWAVATGPVVAIAAGELHSLALRADGTVTAWGDNSWGQANVPSGLNNVVAIAAGELHSLALKADGTVVGWGYNSSGQTNVPPGLTNVVAIVAGDWHNLALKADGTVVGWGQDYDGSANGAMAGSNVVAIAAGERFSLALKADGTVTAWGDNFYGQISVPPGLGNVVAIAASDHHSLALKADGTVATWGDNYPALANVPSGLTNVVTIATGPSHSLALKSDGTVTAWGDNNVDQTNTPPSATNVVAITAGGGFSLALRSDGTVLGWGYPDRLNIPPSVNVLNALISRSGTVNPDIPGTYPVAYSATNSLGAGVTAMRTYIVGEKPSVVTLPATNLVSVRTLASGTLKGIVTSNAWPIKAWFEWSDTLNVISYTPVIDVPTGTTITMTNRVSNLTAGAAYSYRLIASNVIGVSFGVERTFSPLLLTPNGLDAWFHPLHVPYVDLGATASASPLAVASGDQYSLALKTDGTVFGWGDNSSRQLEVPAGAANALAIAAGLDHCLALKPDHRVIAWGDNSDHESDVPPGLANITAIAAGAGYRRR